MLLRVENYLSGRHQMQPSQFSGCADRWLCINPRSCTESIAACTNLSAPEIGEHCFLDVSSFSSLHFHLDPRFASLSLNRIVHQVPRSGSSTPSARVRVSGPRVFPEKEFHIFLSPTPRMHSGVDQRQGAGSGNSIDVHQGSFEPTLPHGDPSKP